MEPRRKNEGLWPRSVWTLSLAAALAAAAFFAGLFVGRARPGGDVRSFTVEYERPEESAYVYTAPETAKININTATVEQLTSLRGIGEALAEKIAAYRREHGDFKYEYEIMNVSGIGEAKYKAIKDYITVK